jgi:hypothetical protein
MLGYVSVKEMLRSVDSTELTEWQAYFKVKSEYQKEAEAKAEARAKAKR